MRDTVNLSKDIDLTSTVISLNDEPTWVLRTEQADYKLSELLSDMGGSMSLILGLRFLLTLTKKLSILISLNMGKRSEAKTANRIFTPNKLDFEF